MWRAWAARRLQPGTVHQPWSRSITRFALVLLSFTGTGGSAEQPRIAERAQGTMAPFNLTYVQGRGECAWIGRDHREEVARLVLARRAGS
jgi:hypothetical protein